MSSRLAGGTVLLVLACFCLPQSTPVIADCGVCFARCTDACHEIWFACRDRCLTDCAAMFPNDPAQFVACRETCRLCCTSQNQDCRMACHRAPVPEPMQP